ncbi:MAG: hypothetical protein GWO08_03190, partial [Gammaproteobacteria bacterium]|nr:hypothetical protein [Gammaproteobacteria bacterium]NIR92689.1 hypothetical protein [Gammaproteobacteria bacterium]NIW48355.1 hypothetical protein [Gammaproteobacteria bacterium]
MKINQHIIKHTRTAILTSTVLLLQACSVGGQILKETDSVGNVSKDEVIVVGTIELTPKLGKDEQSLDPSGVIDFGYGEMNRNRAMIQFNNQPKVSDYKSVINPELGKTFFFTIPRDMKYMVEGSILMEFTRRGSTGQI